LFKTIGGGLSNSRDVGDVIGKMPVLPMTRRGVLFLSATTCALASVGWPRGVLGAPAEAAAEFSRFTGGKVAEIGKIAIDIAELVENGNSVPLFVAIDSAMTPDDHVTEILVVGDGNPQPRVATFRFTPKSGRAEVATRIRLATTQNLIIVARTSQGKVHAAHKEVKVAIGGCGG
jgi:sulfur-oxidizing protein SoxY